MSDSLLRDYLVVSAGAPGLAFVDELVNHDCGNIIIVDKRHAVGDHWNDALQHLAAVAGTYNSE